MAQLFKILTALSQGREIYSVFWDREGGWMKYADPADSDRGIFEEGWLPEIDELCFFETSTRSGAQVGTILAVIPIVPGKDTQIELKESGSDKATLTIKVKIRLYLGPGEERGGINPSPNQQIFFRSQIALRNDFDAQRFAVKEPSFISASFFHELKPFTYVFSVSSFFSDFLQVLNRQGSYFCRDIKTNTGVRPEVRPHETSNFAEKWQSDLAESVGVYFPSDLDQPKWILHARFEKREAFGPLFMAILDLKPGKSNLKGFDLEFERDKLPTQTTSAGLFNRHLRIWQRSPFPRIGRETDPFWIIDISFPTTEELLTRWNDSVAQPILNAISIVDRATNISAMPTFELQPNTKPPLAVARYSVADTSRPRYEDHVFPFKLETLGRYDDCEPDPKTGRLIVHMSALRSEDSQAIGIAVDPVRADLPEYEQLESTRSKITLQFKHVRASERSTIRIGSLKFDVPIYSGKGILTKPSLDTASRFDVSFARPNSKQFFTKGEDFQPKSIEINDGRLVLEVDGIGAAGQDKVPGFKSAQQFERSAADTSVDRKELKAYELEEPIVFEIESLAAHDEKSQNTERTTASYFIVFFEWLINNKNHTVDISLYKRTDDANETKEKKSSKSSYFVIDRSPMLMGRVDVDALEDDFSSGSSGEIANFSTRSGESWEIVYGVSPSTIVLPPQGIGEAAEKRSGPSDIETDPIDFRFTPPAKLTISGSYFDQRFGEVPWNLRRLLGYAGQRDPGTDLQQADFELFYGINANIAKKDKATYKLSELASALGSMASAPPQQPFSALSPAQQSAYSIHKREWAELYAVLKHRLGILEVRDALTRENVISRDLTCTIRESAHLKFPLESVPDGLSSIPKNANDPTKGLAGGVGWVFDSAVIYDALWYLPTSVSASIRNLKFSTLGGWGFQVAKFAKGTIRISTDTTMGRTHYIKVEVYGRIAVGWNKAKHVTIFERSVCSSRQFFMQQDRLVDLPILRKMEEYVEILEFDSPVKESDAPAFFKSIHFDEAFNKIPVDSSWGQDLFATWGTLPDRHPLGWTVPLWNSTAQPADVYRKPQTFIDLSGRETGSIERCAVQDPQKLAFFYLSPVAEERWKSTKWEISDFADPHTWPSIPEVDFTAIPEDYFQAPQFEMDPEKREEPKPVCPGLSRFSLTLSRPSSPVNVVAGKTETAIGASLRNVTVMRGFIESAKIAFNAKDTIENTLDTTIQYLNDLDAGIDRANVKLDSYKKDLKSALSSIKLPALTLDCPTLIEEARLRLMRKKDQLLAVFEKFIRSEVQTIRAEKFENDIRTAIQNAQTETDKLAAAKMALKKTIQREMDRFRLDLRMATTVFMTVRESGKAVKARAEVLRNELSKLQNAAKTEINKITDDATKDQIEKVFRNLKDQVTAWDNRIEGQVGQTLSDNFASIEWAIEEFLRPLIGRFSGICALVVNVILSVFLDLQKDILNKIDELQAGLKDPLDPSSIRKQLIAVVDATDCDKIFDRLNQALTTLCDAVPADTGNKLASELANMATSIEHAMISAVDVLASVDDVNSAVAEILKKWIASFKEGLSTFLEQQMATEQMVDSLLRSLVETLANEYGGAFCTTLGDVIKVMTVDLGKLFETKALDRIADSVGSDLNKTLEDASKEVTYFKDQVLGYVDRAERALKDKAQAILISPDKTISNALQTVRAFGNAPEVPNLNFDLKNSSPLSGAKLKLAYNYVAKSASGEIKEILDGVGITPVFSLPSETDLMNLNPMSLSVPSFKLLDRIIPAALDAFDLRDIVKDLALFKLDGLFDSVKAPPFGDDHVKITHGIDPQSKSGWMQTDLNFDYGSDKIQMLSIAGATVSLDSPKLKALSRTEVKAGQSPRQIFNGEIGANFDFGFGGLDLVTIEEAKLRCDESKKIRFDIKPENIKLKSGLQFLSDLLSITDSDNGFRTEIVGAGIRSTLSLPMPDISLGSFSIANLNLGFSFQVGLSTSNQFELKTHFNLASESKPFTMTLFLLGGAGWLDFDLLARPEEKGLYIETKFSICIALAASFAINLGPISGGISAYFGIKVVFIAKTGSASNLTIGIIIMFSGHVDVCGIISADICLTLEAEYSSSTGQMVGRGTVRIKIRICWCFTLSVNKSVSYSFGGKKSHGIASAPQALTASSPTVLEAIVAPAAQPPWLGVPDSFAKPVLIADLAQEYVEMFAW